MLLALSVGLWGTRHCLVIYQCCAQTLDMIVQRQHLSTTTDCNDFTDQISKLQDEPMEVSGAYKGKERAKNNH